MNPIARQKEEVQEFWNADPCGTRYLEGKEDFEAHAHARYALEPYIFDFAKFQSARGLKVLEIGVGMGADYLEWLKAGALAAGVDLSAASIEKARQRCERAGYQPDLRVADAEQLRFPDNSFDLVYSYGVMHHSPNTTQCIREARRVLKPGGQARIMVYHHPSITGAMLWLRYGVLRGKSLRQSVFDHLESPGTKTYTRDQALQLLDGFRDVEMRVVFSPGDLLLHQPSARFQSGFYRLVWKLFPRTLARQFGRRWGLFLLITATKAS
jgi:SAM-dependent methyltransferase